MSHKKLPQPLIIFVLAIVFLVVSTLFSSSTLLIRAQHEPTNTSVIRFITADEKSPSTIPREMGAYASPFCLSHERTKPFLTLHWLIK